MAIEEAVLHIAQAEVEAELEVLHTVQAGAEEKAPHMAESSLSEAIRHIIREEGKNQAVTLQPAYMAL